MLMLMSFSADEFGWFAWMVCAWFSIRVSVRVSVRVSIRVSILARRDCRRSTVAWLRMCIYVCVCVCVCVYVYVYVCMVSVSKKCFVSKNG